MENLTKIVLAGGGGTEDSRLLDELLASWIGPKGRILYLPIALRGIRSFELCLEWIRTTFVPFAITQISMWTDLTEHRADELEEFDVVYIGGGNTYSLLAELIASGFHRHLKVYAKRGGILYGGSAGAVVLGTDIRTISHIDRNEIGLTEVNCLNLAEDHAVFPHYTPQNDEFIERFVEKHRQPVLAIPERSGIVIESGQLRSVGFEPSYRFTYQGKLEI